MDFELFVYVSACWLVMPMPLFPERCLYGGEIHINFLFGHHTLSWNFNHFLDKKKVPRARMTSERVSEYLLYYLVIQSDLFGMVKT